LQICNGIELGIIVINPWTTFSGLQIHRYNSLTNLFFCEYIGYSTVYNTDRQRLKWQFVAGAHYKTP